METTPIKDKYDVIVIGARCAGSATAMLLARMGAKILVVDQAAPGSDTLSTHALMRGAVMQLQNWDILSQIAATGTPPVRTTSFIYGDAPPIDITMSPTHGTHALYAPRRTVLDRTLANAATEAGATVRYGVKCRALLRGPDGSVKGVILCDNLGETHSVKAELVIGADGRTSSVAQLVGAEKLKQGAHASQCVYGYFSGLPDSGFRWHWGEGCAGGIIPTNDGQSCVFLSMSNTRTPRFSKLTQPTIFRDFISRMMPAFSSDIADAKLVGRLVGFGGQPGYLRRSKGNGWALVGDAGYFKDPITAHGITDALRDAQILAQSWADCRLDDYVATRDALSHDMLRISDNIASFQSSMPELMRLHEDLNLAMKANQNWIADNLYQMARAA